MSYRPAGASSRVTNFATMTRQDAGTKLQSTPATTTPVTVHAAARRHRPREAPDTPLLAVGARAGSPECAHLLTHYLTTEGQARKAPAGLPSCAAGQAAGRPASDCWSSTVTAGRCRPSVPRNRRVRAALSHPPPAQPAREVPKTAEPWVATPVRTVADQPDTGEVKTPFARVPDTIADKSRTRRTPRPRPWPNRPTTSRDAEPDQPPEIAAQW